MPLTSKLNSLIELAGKAFAGPWEFNGSKAVWSAETMPVCAFVPETGDTDQHRHTLQFIAASHPNIITAMAKVCLAAEASREALSDPGEYAKDDADIDLFEALSALTREMEK